MRAIVFGATVAVLLCLCCSERGRAGDPVNPNLSPVARQVLQYLESTYQKKVLAGYNVYVHTPDDYEQTGKQAAIWGRDIRWLGDVQEVAQHAKRLRYILTLHWHWHFGEDSAWTGKRKTPIDVGKIVTPGTREYKQAMAEMDAAADKLQVLEDAGVPVLWRPLHEIDGGWFWWTDKQNPENTAALWRLMYDHFTHVRKLDNLIWVYSAGVGKKDVEYRKRFYPGAAYVDISGIDIYGVDFKTADQKYVDYHRDMSQVSPGKMLACGECDAIPDPNLMQNGTLWSSAKSDDEWLYVDLGDTYRIDRVNLLWGWKIHPTDFAIDVAVRDPNVPDSWAEVSSVTDRAYQTWEATDRVRFKPTEARYMRVRAMKRAGNQTWSGYKLAAMEIPVARELVNERP